MFRDNKLQDDYVALERFGRWQNDMSLHRAAFPLRVVPVPSPRRRLVDTVLQERKSSGDYRPAEERRICDR